MTLSDELRTFLNLQGADLIGFADLHELDTDTRNGFPFGISIAVTLEPEIIAGIEDGPNHTYYKEYQRANKLLGNLGEQAALFIKENGYAIDDEELSVGLRCIGAPLFDHNGQARYAISISGPSIRFGSKRIEQMQRELKKICQSLSGKIGRFSF